MLAANTQEGGRQHVVRIPTRMTVRVDLGILGPKNYLGRLAIIICSSVISLAFEPLRGEISNETQPALTNRRYDHGVP